ncbi:hypothetical protein K474DRAFT_1680600 [Panus rudis PR-1116 ss-1]|nr:hypothetical protein K474DRAFT_1680600 [Panus rudis PR-1116 ss-1]
MYTLFRDVGAALFLGGVEHYGSAPTCLKMESPYGLVPWACRMSMVGYPPGRYVEGQCKIVMAPQAIYKPDTQSSNGQGGKNKKKKGKKTRSQPESYGIYPKTVSSMPTTKTATILVDALAVAEPVSVVNQGVRYLASHWVDFLSMLPAHVGVEVNVKKLLESTTVRGLQGERIPMDDWEFMPYLPKPGPDARGVYEPGGNISVTSKYREDPEALRMICDDGVMDKLAERRKKYARVTTVGNQEAPYLERVVRRRPVKLNRDGSHDQSAGTSTPGSGTNTPKSGMRSSGSEEDSYIDLPGTQFRSS